MKKIIRYSITTILTPVICFVMLSGFLNEPEDTPVALIKKVVKEVTYRDSDQNSDWEEARAGIPLVDGNEIRTGFKSLALVLFTDGSGVLRVRENSFLQIYGKKEADRIDKNTYIDKGEVGFEISKQEEEQFTFTTPTVVASIRGTNGYVDVGDDSTTTIMCNRGSIDLNALLGSRQSGNLTGGNSAVIGTDGSISMGPATGAQQNKFNKSTKVETKTIRIRTNRGTLEIEYIPESDQ